MTPTSTRQVERLKNGTTRRAIDLLDGVLIPEVEGKLAARIARIKSRGYDRGPWTTKRYRAMLAELRDMLTRANRAARDGLRSELRGLAVDEARWLHGAITASLPEGISIGFVLPATSSLRAVASGPIFDETLTGWFRGITRASFARSEKAISRGFLLGESTDDIVRRLMGRVRVGGRDGVLQATRNQVAMVARTGVTQISSRAREITFQENADVVHRVQWVSTLDSRTSEICASLDGQTFKVGEGIRPPAHPHCRSTIVPVLPSWRDLGIKDPSPGTRASMDGQVPADQTFGDWFKNQSRARQNETFGPGKADLLRRGMPVQKLVDPKTLRPLNLDELRALGW